MFSLGFFIHIIILNFVWDLFLFLQYIPPRFNKLVLLKIIQCKKKISIFIIQRFFCLQVQQYQNLISQHSGEPKGVLHKTEMKLGALNGISYVGVASLKPHSYIDQYHCINVPIAENTQPIHSRNDKNKLICTLRWRLPTRSDNRSN